MQRGRRPPPRKDAVVRLLLGPLRNAPPDKRPLQHRLVIRLLGPLHNSPMRRPRDAVRLRDKRNLKFVLDNPALLDDPLQHIQVLLVKAQERDPLRHLPRDGKHGGRPLRGEVRQHGVDLVGELDLVDVPLAQRVLGRHGEAHPDDVVRVNGRDEERGAVGGHVVGEVAVGEAAAREVVEVAALPARSKSVSSLPLVSGTRGQGGSSPEGHGRVVVLLHLRHPALEVQNALRAGHALADGLGHTAGVRLGGVLALQNILESHCGEEAVPIHSCRYKAPRGSRDERAVRGVKARAAIG